MTQDVEREREAVAVLAASREVIRLDMKGGCVYIKGRVMANELRHILHLLETDRKGKL